jgi:hypothetical protein
VVGSKIVFGDLVALFVGATMGVAHLGAALPVAGAHSAGLLALTSLGGGVLRGFHLDVFDARIRRSLSAGGQAAV